MKFLKSIDKETAWQTTQHLLMMLGCVLTVAMAASMQWWLFLTGWFFIVLCWMCLYRLELGIKIKLSNKFNVREVVK